jgi:hypothetical protein
MTVAEWVRAHVDEVVRWPAITVPERLCLVAGCDRSEFAARLCRTHYKRARRAMEKDGSPKDLGQ